MNKYNLSKDVKEKMSKYINDGIIKRSIIPKILTAESNDDVVKAMVSMYDLSNEQKMRLWYYTVCNVWRKDDISTCFNEREGIFFRQLIENCGLLKKTDCTKIEVLRTDHITRITSENMRDLGLIDIYTLSNNEVIFVLSLKFFTEVFKDEK